MDTKKKCKCKQCGWTWGARVERPAQCPRCKRYDWEKEEGKSKG